MIMITWRSTWPNSPLEMSDAPVDALVHALGQRGFLKFEQGDKDGAIEDYTTIIGRSDISTIFKAKAFRERGVIKMDAGDKKGALEDFSAVRKVWDEFVDVWVWEGQAELTLGRVVKAEERRAGRGVLVKLQQREIAVSARCQDRGAAGMRRWKFFRTVPLARRCRIFKERLHV